MGMGAAASSGNWESDFTFLDMALVMGLVTAFKAIIDGESERVNV